MEQMMLEKLEGYEEIAREIEISRKYGSDFAEEKGAIRQLIERIHPKRVILKVSEVIEETPTTKTFRLVPTQGVLPPFQAGQYISLGIDTGEITTNRPYSISSSPTEKGYWDITVRRIKDGLISNLLLDNTKPGDTFISSGPQGVFHYNPIIHENKLVFVTGGCGLTPFMSMIREAVRRDLDREICLIYGSINQEELIFHRELTELAQRKSEFTYFPVLENPPDDFSGFKGYVTAEVIKKAVGTIQGKTFFFCGPQAMYDFCNLQFAELGIPERKIKREMYGAPAKPWESPGWPESVDPTTKISVSVNGTRVADTTASESLINVLDRHHKCLPALCRSGECSMCRVKLLSGKVFQPEGTMLRKSDRQFGFIHACVSYPLTDVDICF